MHRKYLVILPSLSVLLTAGAVGGWLVRTKPRPEALDGAKGVPTVEVVRVEGRTSRVPVVGYGTIRPKRQVQIVPEVSGRLTYVHKDLAVGNTIPKGEILVEIDPRPYESGLRQVQAEIERLEAEIARQELERAGLEERVAVAERQLELTTKSVEREKGLLSQGSATEPELEAAEGRFLQQQQLLLESRSRLGTIPYLMAETRALIKLKQAQAEEAALQLQRTTIRCPFDAGVDSVTAQESQAVVAGMPIAALTDMEALELPVVVEPSELRWIDLGHGAAGGAEANGERPEARVFWTLQGRQQSWTGPVMRLERLDEQTRTARIAVEIRDVLKIHAEARARGWVGLSSGMFCRAELPGIRLDGAIIVPRHAIHDDSTVYVFVPDPNEPHTGSLAMRKVSPLRGLEDQVLVAYDRIGQNSVGESAAAETELEAGDLLIVSPLSRPVPGMRLMLRDASPRASDGTPS